MWRDIRGYEGLYQVSNEGRVRSLDRVVIRSNGRPITIKGKIKEPTEWNIGYLMVKLSKNGDCKFKLVHDLVAEAFIPNSHGYTVVHHKNHNTHDNRVENLEWMDWSVHSAMHNSKRVDQIDCITGEVLRQWKNAYDVERELGYDHRYISQCCNGGYKHRGKWFNVTQVYGYVWKHVLE